MESMLSATFNGALALRMVYTAIDPSSLDASSAAGPMTDHGVTSMGQYTAAEMGFEARNWTYARYMFQCQRGHKDKGAMGGLLLRQETLRQQKRRLIRVTIGKSKERANRYLA